LRQLEGRKIDGGIAVPDAPVVLSFDPICRPNASASASVQPDPVVAVTNELFYINIISPPKRRKDRRAGIFFRHERTGFVSLRYRQVELPANKYPHHPQHINN
jgi:hypothetical protein